VDGAGIVPVEIESGGLGADFNAGSFGQPLAITDGNGAATLKFDEPGTYILSAKDVESDMEIPLMAPWLEVTVAESAPRLQDILFASASSNGALYELQPALETGTLAYKVVVPDALSTFYMRPVLTAKDTAAGHTIKVMTPTGHPAHQRPVLPMIHGNRCLCPWEKAQQAKPFGYMLVPGH
jgi:hypothetical protein